MKDEIKQIVEKLPSAMPAKYTLNSDDPVNIVLEGELEVQIDNELLSGVGKVELKLRPYPHLSFEFWANEPIQTNAVNLIGKKITVPCGSGPNLEGAISRFTWPGVISGKLQNCQLPNLEEVSSARFHVFNMPQLNGPAVKSEKYVQPGRISFNVENWLIVLDPTDECKKQFDLIKAERGFGITYVGSVKKKNDCFFNASALDNLLSALGSFFSFFMGRWTPVSLEILNDGQTEVECFRLPIMTSYSPVHNWFDSICMSPFQDLFPKFYNLWNDPCWDGELFRLIGWYVEASSAEIFIESKVTLTQAALEKLAWLLIVEINGYNKKKFNSYEAKTKLKMLFEELSIPTEIPAECPRLREVAKSFKTVDGAEIITVMRNSIIHPRSRKKSYMLNNRDLEELWSLGLWYLELCVLAILEYRGEYSYRLKREKWQGEVIDVPWV